MICNISVKDEEGGNVNEHESNVEFMPTLALALSASHWISLKSSQILMGIGEHMAQDESLLYVDTGIRPIGIGGRDTIEEDLVDKCRIMMDHEGGG
jgi:hypothetical protein